MSTAVTAHESEATATHEQRAFGFWLYLMGDAVIFALLFATYVIMVKNTAGGPGGKDLFDLKNAGIETALLLVSSTTVGFASGPTACRTSASSAGSTLVSAALPSVVTTSTGAPSASLIQ